MCSDLPELDSKHAASPFLRWAGSKRRMLPILLSYWNKNYKCYIEPFMGSATPFFAFAPKRAILGDINAKLVNVFKAVKADPIAIHKELSKFSLNKETYYKVREHERLEYEASSSRQAARFIYLNRFCFNGLYRTNSKGQFNVPYAAARTGQLPSLEQLKNVARVLADARLVTNDFSKTISLAKKGDFIYMDPPFAVENRRIFKQYSSTVFGTKDLERLAKQLPLLDKRGVKFVVSYALCREAQAAFKEWDTRRIVTQRNISGFAKHRKCAVELLISNVG